MKQFTAKKFNIPDLKGISKKNIEEHLKLYQGYVNNANLVLQKMSQLSKDREKNAYELGELARHFSFEYDGMRNHELYFSAFEGGAYAMDEGNLKKMIEDAWGNVESWLAEFKFMGLTRGIGWAMLYFDPVDGRLLNSWVEEQHQGQLAGCFPILGLDMWEHSYVFDYQPSGKKQYIEDFFFNLNWKAIEENLSRASGAQEKTEKLLFSNR